jgi:hypothetical protein
VRRPVNKPLRERLVYRAMAAYEPPRRQPQERASSLISLPRTATSSFQITHLRPKLKHGVRRERGATLALPSDKEEMR